jgi:hypothetical protein
MKDQSQKDFAVSQSHQIGYTQISLVNNLLNLTNNPNILGQIREAKT